MICQVYVTAFFWVLAPFTPKRPTKTGTYKGTRSDDTFPEKQKNSVEAKKLGIRRGTKEERNDDRSQMLRQQRLRTQQNVAETTR